MQDMQCGNALQERETDFSREFNTLSQNISHLEDKYQELVSKVAPITRQPEPSGCDKAERVEPSTQVGGQLRTLTDRVQSQLDMLTDLMNRMEI